jgi:hypothetical protein
LTDRPAGRVKKIEKIAKYFHQIPPDLPGGRAARPTVRHWHTQFQSSA